MNSSKASKSKKQIRNTTVDPEDVARFERLASQWWDPQGKFKPLHRFNPVRLAYIKELACTHFQRSFDEPDALTGISALDVGCGGGLICEPLARLGCNVTGIDAGLKNIEAAKIHGRKMNLNIDYRVQTAEELATHGVQYDLVLALEIIEHVADVQVFIDSVLSLVKPGGLVVLSTINRTLRSYALAIVGAEYILRWLPRGTHDWNKFITPDELQGWLKDRNGQDIQSMGLQFNPISNQWNLSQDCGVNYMISATMPA